MLINHYKLSDEEFLGKQDRFEHLTDNTSVMWQYMRHWKSQYTKGLENWNHASNVCCCQKRIQHWSQKVQEVSARRKAEGSSFLKEFIRGRTDQGKPLCLKFDSQHGCSLHTLAIIAPVKAADRYILEWLDHHLVMGFTLFVLDVESMDLEPLQPYVDAGIIHLMSEIWYSTGENAIHAHMRQVAANKSYWFVPVDADEFMYPLHWESVAEYLHLHMPGGADDIDAIKVPRLDFGSSGYIRPPSSGTYSVTTTYTQHANYPSHFKQIARSSNVDKSYFEWAHPHWNKLTEGSKSYYGYIPEEVELFALKIIMKLNLQYKHRL